VTENHASDRVVVIIPTYNEIDALPDTLARLRATVPDADVLVVDDGGPDGTADWVEQQAVTDSAVHLIRRTGKQGLGTAYLAGFRWGLDRGYDVLVEMDADGSHLPEQLPLLLARTADADLVVGSRWVSGGRVVNWPRNREVLSRGANIYTRLAMGVPLRDSTAGFRAYRAAMLEKLDLAGVASQGYCFQIDMSWLVHQAGGRIVEVPITFVERTAGESKMSRGIVFEALSRVTVWGVQHRAAQLRELLRLRKH
jgi:dolichol-phosphate mannosyltransferase